MKSNRENLGCRNPDIPYRVLKDDILRLLYRVWSGQGIRSHTHDFQRTIMFLRKKLNSVNGHRGISTLKERDGRSLALPDDQRRTRWAKLLVAMKEKMKCFK